MPLRTAKGETCLVLLKLGKKEHLEMFRRGLLYMNSLAFFMSLESDSARSDPYEGTDRIVQARDIGEVVLDPCTPGFKTVHIGPSDLAGPVTISLRQTSLCNIFCMFAISQPIDDSIFTKDHCSFGDSVILITDTQRFLSRVDASAKRDGLKGQCRLVEYYDEAKYSGELGRFRKRSVYSYQHEFRIVLETGAKGPLRFDVGDLSDITSEIIPIDVANDVLKFRSTDAEAAGMTWD